MTSFNEREGTDPIQATQQRLIQGALDADWQYLNGASSERFSLSRAEPLFIQLGQRGIAAAPHDTLAVVNPSIHLPELAQIGLSHKIPAFLIQPTLFDPINNIGFKALRANDHLTIGRSATNMEHLTRFGSFSGQVSNNHLDLAMDTTGSSFVLRDLQSTNGTSLFEKFVPWRAASFADTHASESHPDINQDAYVRDDKSQLYGVFDGMGGTRDGGTAARLAARVFTEEGRTLSSSASEYEMASNMRYILTRGNASILSEQDGSDMGTTAVIAKVHTSPDGMRRIATIASVGDSRAYLLRNGVLTAVTTDHSAYRRKNGKDAAKEHQDKLASVTTETINTLSPEEQTDFRYRHMITSSLGRQDVEIDVEHVDILPGDVLLLTSDGVHDNLTTNEIQATLARSPDNTRYAKDLVRFAHERSHQKNYNERAKADDITAVAVEL